MTEIEYSRDMTTRERMLAVLRGEMPDRIPWVPRIDLWYGARTLSGTVPEHWQGKSLREIERALFSGTAARNGAIFTLEYDGVEIVKNVHGDKETTIYNTPLGSVDTIERISPELKNLGLPGRVEKELLQGPNDYRIWEYVVEHSVWKPCYGEYEQYDSDIGSEGVPMVQIGDVPFHDFVQNLAGYNDAFYQISDYRAEVEHLLMVMSEVQKERMWPVVVDSPAMLLLHGMHLSTQFTPPTFFEQYVLPYCQEIYPSLKESGKWVTMHADNDTSRIAELIEQAGWDMVECFVTSPMVPMTLEKAKQVWGSRIVIWGGIPSILLSPSFSFDTFRRHVEEVFTTIKPGNGIILGIADNVMPDSDIQRVQWISDYVEAHGVCPM